MNFLHPSRPGLAHTVLEGNGIGYWEFSQSGDMYLSESCRSILGIGVADNVKDQILNKIHPDDLLKNVDSRFITGLRKKVTPSSGPEKLQLRLNTETERYIRVINHWCPNAEDTGLRGILEDVTEEVLSQKSILLSLSKMATLGKLTSTIAHEMNNPLSIITTYVRFLKEHHSFIKDDTTDKVKICLTKIEQTTDRIVRIIRGLNNVSSPHAESLEKINFVDLLKDAIEISAEKCKTHDITLRYECHENVELNCYPVEIVQVLMNLIANSIYAIKDFNERWIKISVAIEDSFIQITTTDSGLGIQESCIEKMMSPYYTTKTRGDGNGLGLAISTEIIRKHKGHFFYNSNAANTQFVIKLPICSPY